MYNNYIICRKNTSLLCRLLLILSLITCLSSCKSRSKSSSCLSWPSKSSGDCQNSYDKNYQGSVHVGNPYKVKNKTYTPKLEHSYDEVGIASWYGHHFHCKKTANGEIFDKNQLSGAHKTLPLPSVVKVTNLSNNLSVNVVINDRGPFSKNRLIDISEKAAISLGMKHHGTAKVRVQLLPEETNKLMRKIDSNKKIYYKEKPKHKFEIIINQYKTQKEALTAMRKVSKLGEVHLLAEKNNYKPILVTESKVKAKKLLKQIINMGYKNAKINFN